MEIDIINMPLNLGCNKFGTELGGRKIREYGFDKIFQIHKTTDKGDIYCKPLATKASFNEKMKNLPDILSADKSLADAVYESLNEGHFPLIIGGDHSMTWGSLSGVSKYYSSNIGCIYLDAHGDFNSRDSSPTGNVHGMHMYYLMGYGDDDYVNFYTPGQKIKPQNIFFLGTRSLDKGEQLLSQKEDLNIFSTQSIRTLGVENIYDQLLSRIANLTKIHFSLDIDCLDPSVAPGTGVPEPDGLTLNEVEYLVKKILSTGKVVSMDLVEFNPLLDIDNQTFDVCKDILKLLDKSPV